MKFTLRDAAAWTGVWDANAGWTVASTSRSENNIRAAGSLCVMGGFTCGRPSEGGYINAWTQVSDMGLPPLEPLWNPSGVYRPCSGCRRDRVQLYAKPSAAIARLAARKTPIKGRSAMETRSEIQVSALRSPLSGVVGSPRQNQ